MNDREMTIAMEAVKMAGLVCRAVQHDLAAGETLEKADRSPVTVADFSSQAIINYHLIKACPDIPIVAEEGADELRDRRNRDLLKKVHHRVQSQLEEISIDDMLDAIDSGNYEGGAEGRFWTLDPIDGTKGFIRGDQYAIALALIENGEPVMAVLGCPALPVGPLGTTAEGGCLCTAVRGKGCVLIDVTSGEEIPLRVSDQQTAAAARFCESVEAAHTAHGWAHDVIQALNSKAEPARLDSQCKYAVVARGEADVYMRLPTRKDYQEKIWDHAAGALCVTEAGGRVTDIDGNELDFSRGRTLCNNRGVLCTNGAVHDPIMKAIHTARPE